MRRSFESSRNVTGKRTGWWRKRMQPSGRNDSRQASSSSRKRVKVATECQLFFFLFSLLANVNVDDPEYLCVCVCVCVCVSLASDSLETIKVIFIKLGRVTASDMKMHHVLIILTLTFTQGHTYLNRENNKCSIMSETAEAAMPIKFAVKIVRRKFYM